MCQNYLYVKTSGPEILIVSFSKPIPLNLSKDSTRTPESWEKLGPNEAIFLHLETHEAGDSLGMVFPYYAFGQYLLSDYQCFTCLLPQLKIFLQDTGQGCLLQFYCCLIHSNLDYTS